MIIQLVAKYLVGASLDYRQNWNKVHDVQRTIYGCSCPGKNKNDSEIKYDEFRLQLTGLLEHGPINDWWAWTYDWWGVNP